MPSPRARARRKPRSHQSRIEEVSRAPVRIHHPPSCKGTIGERPNLAAGGSSVRKGKSRAKATGSQFTEAHMLSPMISKAEKPRTSEMTPSQPR